MDEALKKQILDTVKYIYIKYLKSIHRVFGNQMPGPTRKPDQLVW